MEEIREEVQTGRKIAWPVGKLLVLSVLTIVTSLSVVFLPRKTDLTPKADTTGEVTYFVSPSGNDNNPGSEAAPFRTIEKAKNEVRSINSGMTGNITVYLRNGTYFIDSPLEFSAADSGQNGFKVIYASYPGEQAMITGGQEVRGFVADGANWKVNIGSGRIFRQFYMNGVKAIRARSSGGLPSQAKTTTGFTTSLTAMANWRNLTEIEFVGNQLWRQYRCRVASMNGNSVILTSPCWPNSQLHDGFKFDTVTYIENAFELIDSAREWYYDKTTGWLYYRPGTGESMATAVGMVPVGEQFAIGGGTTSDKMHDITFADLKFSYFNYRAPSSDDGWVERQANWTQRGQVYTDFWRGEEKPMAIIDLLNTRGVVFSNNEFSHLGGAAIFLGNGTHEAQITGNEFFDIASNGIMLGDVDLPKTTNVDEQTVGNRISKNIIHKTGNDYAGAVGIWLGYTKGSQIDANTLYDLPYTAISIGWGWGGWDPTFAQNNIIEKNLIFNHVQTLVDGGGIYSLSAQPGNIYINNVIVNQKNDYGAMYLDNNSRFITVDSNIIFNNNRTLLLNSTGDNVLKNNWWQNRYTNDLWDMWNSNFGKNIYENNHVISRLTQTPGEILYGAGTPIEWVTKSGTIVSGKQKVEWESQPFAINYQLRIDDTTNVWTCDGVHSSGDVCIDVTGTSYEYDFQPGRKYNIWIHATNPGTNMAGVGSSIVVTADGAPTPTPTAIPSPTPTGVIVTPATSTPTPTYTPYPMVQNLQPSGTIVAGTKTISWNPTSGALKYYLRVDDKTDAWVCNGVTAAGDVCITQTGTTYSYNFKAGHQYMIWVHAVYNSAGTLYSEGTAAYVTAVAPTPTPLPMVQNLQPSGTISAGTRSVTWGRVSGAVKYYVRIDDLTDPWVCSGVTAGGDVCITQTGTSYSYNFKSGHSYNIWIHAVFNSAGTVYSDPMSSSVRVN